MGKFIKNQTVFNSENVSYCLIRRCLVAKTPEEQIRQSLLGVMIEKLGFPRSLIAVEKSLDQLPHLKHGAAPLPNRRADVLCFGKEIHPEYPLFPLLLIECKQERIDQAAIDQVRGYNAFVGAPFLALADKQGVFFLGEELKRGLPKYQELLEAAQRR